MASLFYHQYIGGKRTEIKYIIEDIRKLNSNKKIDKIVEPFCGSCAVSLHCAIKEQMQFKYHVNDIDESHINFLKYVNKNGTKILFNLIKNFWLDIPQKDQNKKTYGKLFKKYKLEDDCPLKYAHKIFFEKFNGLRVGCFPTTKKCSITYHYENTDKFFSNAIITCKDYNEIFNMYKDDEKALLFLDPPYFDSGNKDYINKGINGQNIIDNTKMYIDIINLLKTCKCKVILIINKNAITDFIYNEYIKKSYDKIYQRTKKKTKHTIINNLLLDS
jgi:site-specific DNA-adenine methylase